MKVTKKRILLVDDDETHLISTRGILEEAGFVVFTHKTPLGTTSVVKRVQPDLVLLDVNMPGLPGDKLSTIVRCNPGTSDVPIVFYSSNDEDTLRKAVRDTGIDGYISKGDPAELRRKVRQLLSK